MSDDWATPRERPTTLEGKYQESIDWLKSDSELPDLWTDIENYVQALKNEIHRLNDEWVKAQAAMLAKAVEAQFTKPTYIEGLFRDAPEKATK